MSGNVATILKNDTRLEDLDARLEAAGETVGTSKDVLINVALDLVRAAADGYLKPGQAQGRYEAYLRGMSRKAVHEHSVGGVTANTSKMKKIIELGCLPNVDGIGVLDMVLDVRSDLKARGVKVQGGYKAMVEAARVQLATPESQITREVIESICDGTPADKDLIDKLIAQYKANVRLQDECPTDNMARVVDALREEIVAQGGNVPAVTKEDKEVAKAVALLAKKGVKLAA